MCSIDQAIKISVTNLSRSLNDVNKYVMILFKYAKCFISIDALTTNTSQDAKWM